MNENIGHTYATSIKLMTFFFSGIAMAYLLNKIKRLFKAKYKERNKLKMSDSEVLREQLKRNYEFFGEEGMTQLKNKFIIVVGIGGVGR